MKTMKGARMSFLATNHRLLIGGVQAEGQNARPSVAVKYEVLIGLDREHRQLPRTTQTEDSIESALAQLSHIHLKAECSEGRAEALS